MDTHFDDPLQLIYIIWSAQKLKFQMFLSFLAHVPRNKKMDSPK